MKAILLLLCLLVAACTNLPVAMPEGQVAYATMVGGKGVLSYDKYGRPIYTYNNEKSLQHALQAGVAGLTSLVGYLTQKSADLTAQLANNNLTGVQKAQISADLAKTQAQLKAANDQLLISQQHYKTPG